MGKNYHVEKNPLADMGGCDGLADYLEKRLAAGFELVAIVSYAGTPHWIFKVAAKATAKAKAGSGSEVG